MTSCDIVTPCDTTISLDSVPSDDTNVTSHDIMMSRYTVHVSDESPVKFCVLEAASLPHLHEQTPSSSIGCGTDGSAACFDVPSRMIAR